MLDFFILLEFVIRLLIIRRQVRDFGDVRFFVLSLVIFACYRRKLVFNAFCLFETFALQFFLSNTQ